MPAIESMPWTPLGASPWAKPACPPLVPLPTHADVVVVGAGITGLSAALRLADAGREVVVLDRAFGDGAACRSGGIVLGDTLVGAAPAFDGCEEDLRNWVQAHGVRGGIDWRGCIELDRDATRSPHPIDWRDAGVVRAGNSVAGGMLDPAALVEALAREAHARGARFVNGSDVSAVISGAPTIAIETSLGALSATFVVLATDASSHPRGVDPWPVRAITVVIETTRPSLRMMQRSGWPEHQPFYTNDLPLLWGRRLPSGGLLVGRELLVDREGHGTDLERAIHAGGLRLGARVRGLHPAFVDLDVARVWAGPIARTAAGVPSLHIAAAQPNIVWAGGYGGHGLAQAFRLGQRAADAALSDRDEPSVPRT
ncbi:MAG: FAD-binding oxidoreductase [Acidobacteriota bacterium]